LKRLMSFTGMLPVGGFLLQHLFSNSYIFNSVEAFNEHSKFLTSLPMVYLLEGGLIYAPIALHAILGIAIIYKGQNNFTSYSRYRNWMFFFQRLTGFTALVFIATHSYSTRIKSVIHGYEMTASMMSQMLAQPFWFWFYMVGVISVVFHFSNGLWSFLVTWGLTVGKKAQRMSGALTMVVFVVLALWSVSILLKFT
ncbi:MAG TPA: succinate dehydrogenase, partial [bacterium]|nr:succinate dehydrogenase [bacterium]